MRFKEDWETVRRRFLALWEREIVDRCCVAVTAPRDGAAYDPAEYPKPVDHDELVRYHRDPERVLERHLAEFEGTYYAGEALPIVYPHWGQSGYALYCNGRYHHTQDSLWFMPTLPDWERDRLRFDPHGDLLRKHQEFVRVIAERGKGSFFVAAADYIGNVDALINLRGVENTLLGMIEHQERFSADLDEMMEVVKAAGSGFFDLIRETNDGGSCIRWYSTWAEGKHNLVQCDFSAMISAEMFERLVLPDLVRTCEWLDCPAYHIDGQEQLRHLDLLLEVKAIRLFQWTNVAGQPPVLAFLPAFKKIQRAGKGLLLFCEMGEVERLLSELSPQGLFLNVKPARSQQEAEALVARVARYTCRRKQP